MSKFPHVIAAVRVALAHDTRNAWAVAEALALDVPADDEHGSRIAAVVAALAAEGLDEANFTKRTLGAMRATAIAFPDGRRVHGASFRAHLEAASDPRGPALLRGLAAGRRPANCPDAKVFAEVLVGVQERASNPKRRYVITVNDVRRVLGRKVNIPTKDDEVVLSAGELAELVASDPKLQRAIARNVRAREAIEEESIYLRAEEVAERRRKGEELVTESERRTREAIARMNRKLGLAEPAIEELRRAARVILEATVLAEHQPIMDADAELEALGRIQRALAIYQGKARINDDDRAWAASIGIDLEEVAR